MINFKTPTAKKILLVLCVLVNCSAIFVTIIGPDGALYASIAKTMVQKGNYIELFAEGKDWLDKPHFPFWMTALSFTIFGINTWAYKLPAILFLLAGAAYTYAFAKKLYNRNVAYWSVIILLTAEHIILSNNDVRAEPYLTGLIIASVYHYYVANSKKNWGHLVLGSLFAACAVMTKGMFALIPIFGAFACEFVVKRKWREAFHVRWVVAFVLVLIFVIPELYCLYYQFDAQPEKLVFGRTGVSGIRFFFWDSQFGRFFNTGPIKGKGDPLFFVHTLLWAFLPWCLLLLAALFRKIRSGIKSRNTTEWYTAGGALLCFLVFSASSFQLPHYINIIFPFFAIITAQYVLSWESKKAAGTWNYIQSIIAGLLLVLMILLHYFFRPNAHLIFGITVSIIIGVLIWLRSPGYILERSALVIVFVNLYLNTVFYPALLKYQSGSEAAFYINKNYAGKQVVQLRSQYSYALDFYLNAPLISVDSVAEIQDMNLHGLLFVSQNYVGEPIRSFEHFHVSRLTPVLLNRDTREREIQHFNLYRLK